jgi:hypothetical protein
VWQNFTISVVRDGWLLLRSSLAAFYYLCGKREVAALEKYSLAAFYYLCGKRGVAALEKYSLAAFYYLCGKRGVAALEKYSVAAFYPQEQPPLSYHRDSKILPHYYSRAANPLLQQK